MRRKHISATQLSCSREFGLKKKMKRRDVCSGSFPAQGLGFRERLVPGAGDGQRPEGDRGGTATPPRAARPRAAASAPRAWSGRGARQEAEPAPHAAAGEARAGPGAPSPSRRFAGWSRGASSAAPSRGGAALPAKLGAAAPARSAQGSFSHDARTPRRARERRRRARPARVPAPRLRGSQLPPAPRARPAPAARAPRRTPARGRPGAQRAQPSESPGRLGAPGPRSVRLGLPLARPPGPRRRPAHAPHRAAPGSGALAGGDPSEGQGTRLRPPSWGQRPARRARVRAEARGVGAALGSPLTWRQIRSSRGRGDSLPAARGPDVHVPAAAGR